jgi:hypothetical protein
MYSQYKAELKNMLAPVSNIGPKIEKEDEYIRFPCLRNVPNTMFDLNVHSKDLQLLLYYDEDEDSDEGKTHTLYAYKDVFFMIDQNFGSCPGCDKWSNVEEDNDDARLAIVHRIIDAIDFKTTIFNVIYPNDWKYACGSWKVKFTGYLAHRGQLDEFNKYVNDVQASTQPSL